MQTGFCGLGCPVNAKRSMLVTMIPDAIDAGAKLVFRARADRFVTKGNAIDSLEATLLDAEGLVPTGKKLTVKAKRFVASCGAINSPALLLRSGIDDAGRVGARTFLHPVIGSGGGHCDTEGSIRFAGAPQGAACCHFAVHRDPDIRIFLEAVPFYPSLSAGAFPGFGTTHLENAKRTKNIATHIALAIDGFHDDVGGRVTLRPSGAPLLDYPISEKLWQTFRFAQKRLAEMQFASGAEKVLNASRSGVVIKRMKSNRIGIASSTPRRSTSDACRFSRRTKWADARWATTHRSPSCAAKISGIIESKIST